MIEPNEELRISSLCCSSFIPSTNQGGVYMRGLRTKRVRTVKEDTLIVTVDVGMASNTGYCATVDGRDIKPFKFGNTRGGSR
jgi:hypothetical protein